MFIPHHSPFPSPFPSPSPSPSPAPALALALALALPAQAAPPTLPDLASTILERLQAGEADYTNLELSLPESQTVTSEGHLALVSVRSPSRMYQLWPAASLSRGGQEFRRNPEGGRTLQMVIPVSLPALSEQDLSALTPLGSVLKQVGKQLDSRPGGIATRQVLLNRPRGVIHFRQVLQVPYSITLEAPGESPLLLFCRHLGRPPVTLSVDSLKLARAGRLTLLTLGGTILADPGTTAGASSGNDVDLQALRATVEESLKGLATDGPELIEATIEGRPCLQARARIASPRAAWDGMVALTQLDGVRGFELFGFRRDTSGETTLSGLLHF